MSCWPKVVTPVEALEEDTLTVPSVPSVVTLMYMPPGEVVLASVAVVDVDVASLRDGMSQVTDCSPVAVVLLAAT